MRPRQDRRVEILRKTDRQRRELLSRAVTAPEEERRALASEIHDDTIDALSAVQLRLGVLRQYLAHAEQLEAFAALEDGVRGAIQRLRSLMLELKPPALDTDGLAPALRGYLERIAERAGFDYEIKSRLAVEPALEVRTVIYRIAQEALANVRKHAGAKNVEIVLEPRGEGVLARIRDDGVGFDAEESQEHLSEHAGLCNMRDRAELAGGWCEVSSTIGTGTLIELWVPTRRD